MPAELNSILRSIAAQERVEALAITLRSQAGARLRVAPILGAARTPLVAALALHLHRPILYIVRDADAALRVTADLSQWLDGIPVLNFPAADALPYEHMTASVDAIAARLGVLRQLHTPSAAGESAPPVPVIVATVRSVMQPTLAPHEWEATALCLRPEQQLNPDELMRRWVELGYRVAPTVEEPGELSRRGGIIDIFPPGDDLPLRIEFFGDEIDSLRRFDPISQRSQARENEALVGPPQEIPLWRTSDALRWLATVDAAAMRPEAVEEWQTALDRLANGERFESIGFFAPFFYERAAAHTLLDHLPPDAPVLFNEALLLAQHAAELHHQAEQRRMLHVETGELPPDFPRPYRLWDELITPNLRLALADLSNNEPLDAGAPDPGAAATDLLAWAHVPAPLFTSADLFGGQLRRLVDDIVARARDHEQVAVVTPQAARIQELVHEAVQAAADAPDAAPLDPQLITFVHGTLDQGWGAPDLQLTLYTDAEIFGWRQRRPVSERKRRRDRGAEERAAFMRGLKVGDHVVHIEHGIAIYDGMVRRSVGGIEREYLNLRYADGDRLYVPADQVDRVSRYIGAGDTAPQLTRLGTQDWERAKRKARAAVQELAEELLELYARRQLSEGHGFSPDTEWQRSLEDAFPFIETDDQLRAIADVKRDMEDPHPMDRLICGDVGFGKTEVALRAAFKAVQDGKQVAVLVPTTVLAQQHYDTFSRRVASFPVKVEMISRFRSAADQARIVAQLARGEVDIIIGTHRLLSKDVNFKNLGLLIIDEEQRFGVRHKERIKQLRANIDVLTLTATPIPRTLHMALAGIRDMSVIDTPPEDRLPIRTYVLPYDERLVREAILRELDRGGQVFYVHNRVQSIYYVADKLRQLVPEAEIAVGHGQMEERQLERVMLDFFSGKDDVLVCTTIIESGLDVPNANTLIIDNATHYGLAQLYQLRGRVGRGAQRAYAYLFFPADRRMTPEAQERLLAIQEATELGAGLRIAMRDLEIRGAGNLLGAEQSGHIAAVGFDLYSRLLEQAVRTMKARLVQTHFRQPGDGAQPVPPAADQAPETPATQAPRAAPRRHTPRVKVDERVLVAPLVTLDLPLDAYLPDAYVPDEPVRLSVYQRLAEAHTPQAVRELRQELRDRFGDPPEPASHLLTWLMIKALALQAGVTSIITTDDEFVVRLPEGSAADREALRRRFRRDTTVRVGPQFARLDRRALGDEWEAALMSVLETLSRARAAEPA